MSRSLAIVSMLGAAALVPAGFALHQAVQRGQAPERPAPPPAAAVPQQDPAEPSWYPYAQRPPFVSELVEEDATDVIYAGNAELTIDGIPENIPPALLTPRFRNGRFVPGWFLVHFEGGVGVTEKALLDTMTGPVRRADGTPLARWYVPNNAMAAWVDDAGVLRALEESDRVDWVGRYQPAYKLDPTIGTATLTSPNRVGRSSYWLNLDLMPGHDAGAVSDAVAAMGGVVHGEVLIRGQQTYDVHFLTVEVAPALVTRLAQIEGVRTIQETGDGLQLHDLSGGGKLQARTLSVDDGADSPIVTAANFPLWLTHDLQGQGQLIGVVDTSLDWNNVGTSGCGFGYPDTNIQNYGFADPNLARVMLSTITGGGVSMKVPRSDLLGGATLLGTAANEHGCAVAGAAAGDFYGNNDTKWWEHDVDNWESWAPSNYSGLLGPGIAHEAQIYFTPVMDSSDVFRWEQPGEFETNMGITLTNMANTGVSATSHSVGLAEASNTYTQVSVTHDTKAFDHQSMLQCMAAGNSGAVANALTSQAVVKNAVAVGASDDVLKPEDRASFSSIGPRFDGARKPDIMAPGTDTFGRTGGVQSLLILPDTNGSSSASCSYQWTSGTSFSAPTITGTTAIIHQFFQEGRYAGATSITDPSAALMKAMLVNSGHRLTGANLGNGQFPNDYQGWGEPNLSDVFGYSGPNRHLVAYDVSSASGFTGAGNGNAVYSIQVNGSTENLEVTLAWTDEPGSAGTGKKLVNDLDLRVTSPGGSVYLGNVFNGTAGTSVTGGTADTLNNVENVIVASPQTGTWTVTVDPGAGNYSVGQGYGLVITGDVAEPGGGPAAPTAQFSGTPTSGQSPLLVAFSDLSTGQIDTWSWTFGDGGTSSAQNPSHTYASAGTYDVSLTVSGPGGSDVNTKVGYITVTAPPAPPVADFTGTPTAGNTPLLVSFSDLSTGNVSSWSWTFGDGGTSSAQNPSHTYTSAGTYDVSLQVVGPGGMDTMTKVGYVTVTDPPVGAPVADFSGTPTSGNAPLAVAFTDLSTGQVDTWSWSFGDGGTSSVQNPSHTYANAGTYDVSLTVSGPGGSDVNTKVGYISVNTPPPSGGLYYLSFTSSVSVPGVGTIRDEDVVTYDPVTDTWAMYFDASDVGVTNDVNALHVLSDGSLVLSFNTTTTIPGLTGGPGGSTTVDDSDLVMFTFTTSGAATSGSFQFVFDGSDVGMTKNGEDIDGVYEFPGGGLAISTVGSASVTGLSGVRDEDVMLFTPTQFGASTVGSFSAYFDGSDVGLGDSSSDDVNAVSFENGIDMLFSTVGTYVGAGSTGADEDISRFVGQFGAATSGTAALELDLSALGISTTEDIDGLCFR